MILEDFHIHTTYCDGKNSAEEMVRAAIDLNMTRLGFSVHSYIAYDEDYCIAKERTSEYVAEIRALAEKFKDKIEILCGVEQDYFSIEPTDGFDYVIGSTHAVKKGDEYIEVDNTAEILADAANRLYGGDFIALAEDYFNTHADVVRKTNADIIGHFDLITKFNQDKRLFDTDDPRYVAAAKAALDKLLTYGKPFEINTGAISRGYRKEAYPEEWQLRYIAENGGRVILSSDSHSTETLCYKFEECERIARDMGFRDLRF